MSIEFQLMESCSTREYCRECRGKFPSPPMVNWPGECPYGVTNETVEKSVTRKFPKVSGIAGGAGTELKNLLYRLGVISTPNCKCAQRARQMDANGVEWCETNRETVVDWLAEEAARRKLPFVRIAARQLVRFAIRTAKKKSNL